VSGGGGAVADPPRGFPRYDDPAPILRRLDAAGDTLELLFNVLSAARVHALAGAPALARLRTLVLVDNRLGDAGLAALLASPHLGALERLAVRRNGLGAAGLRALAAWPGLDGVRALDLGENALDAAALDALVASPHLGGLRLLGLSKIGAADLEPLLRLPVLAELAELDLSGNDVSDRHRGVFDWDRQDFRQIAPTDAVIALRRVLGPRLRL
jgi:hypothetical protein